MKYCCLCGGEGHTSTYCPWREAPRHPSHPTPARESWELLLRRALRETGRQK